MFSYLYQYFEIVHIYIAIKNTNAYEMFSNNQKYFTFDNHTCFFHICENFKIFLTWYTCMLLQRPMKFTVTVTNISHVAAIFVLSHL